MALLHLQALSILLVLLLLEILAPALLCLHVLTFSLVLDLLAEDRLQDI